MQLVLQLIPVSAVNSSYSKEDTATWTIQKEEKNKPAKEIKSYKKYNEK